MKVGSSQLLFRCTITQMIAMFLTSMIAVSSPVFCADSGDQPPSDTPNTASLALSLQDAIRLALEGNPNLIIKRISHEIAESQIETSRAQFDPSVTASTEYGKSKSSADYAGLDAVKAESAKITAGVSGYLPTGTTYQANFSNTASNSAESVFAENTSYASSLSVSASQPLMRGAGKTVVKAPILIAHKSAEISKEALQQTLIDVITNVETLYWDLMYYRRYLDVKKHSLELAQKQMDRTKSLIEAGRIANIELLAAEATVATREEEVLLAEQAAQEAEDTLRQALWLQVKPEDWNVPLSLTDEPVTEEVTMDEDALFQQAMTARPDMNQVRLAIAINQIQLKTANNDSLPDVSAFSALGVGGNEAVYGRNLEELSKGDEYTISVGVNLKVPWYNRLGKSGQQQARLNLAEAQIQEKQLETVIKAQLRNATRSISTAFKRIDVSKKALSHYERRLDAEERRFEVGRSTNIDVFNVQEDLALAENAVLKAVIDYRKAISLLHKVTGATLQVYQFMLMPQKPEEGATP